MMNNEAREIRCADLAELEAEFPLEIAVIREMLEEVAEDCLDQAA